MPGIVYVYVPYDWSYVNSTGAELVPQNSTCNMGYPPQGYIFNATSPNWEAIFVSNPAYSAFWGDDVFPAHKWIGNMCSPVPGPTVYLSSSWLDTNYTTQPANFSFALWIYMTSMAQYRQIFSKRAGGTPTYAWCIEQSGGNGSGIWFGYFRSPSWYTSTVIPSAYVNTWYFVAVTYNNATYTVTTWSCAAGSTPTLVDMDTHPVPLVATADKILIGAKNDGSFPYTGYICNVMFWNDTLTAEDIYQVYTQPFNPPKASKLQFWYPFLEGSGNIAYDASGNNRTGTFSSPPTWGGCAPYVCSNGDLLNLTASSGTYSFAYSYLNLNQRMNMALNGNGTIYFVCDWQNKPVLGSLSNFTDIVIQPNGVRTILFSSYGPTPSYVDYIKAFTYNPYNSYKQADLLNGGFECGDTSGWSNVSSAQTGNTFEGTYAGNVSANTLAATPAVSGLWASIAVYPTSAAVNIYKNVSGTITFVADVTNQFSWAVRVVNITGASALLFNSTSSFLLDNFQVWQANLSVSGDDSSGELASISAAGAVRLLDGYQSPIQCGLNVTLRLYNSTAQVASQSASGTFNQSFSYNHQQDTYMLSAQGNLDTVTVNYTVRKLNVACWYWDTYGGITNNTWTDPNTTRLLTVVAQWDDGGIVSSATFYHPDLGYFDNFKLINLGPNLGTINWAEVRAVDTPDTTFNFSIAGAGCTPYIHVDQIEVYEGGVTDDRCDVNTQQQFWFRLRYKNSGEEITGNGSWTVNFLLGPAAWNAEKHRWERSEAKSLPCMVLDAVSSVADYLHGLHSLVDNVGAQTIIWDGLKLQDFTVQHLGDGNYALIGHYVYAYDNAPASGYVKLLYPNSTLFGYFPVSNGAVNITLYQGNLTQTGAWILQGANDTTYGLTYTFNSYRQPFWNLSVRLSDWSGKTWTNGYLLVYAGNTCVGNATWSLVLPQGTYSLRAYHSVLGHVATESGYSLAADSEKIVQCLWFASDIDGSGHDLKLWSSSSDARFSSCVYYSSKDYVYVRLSPAGLHVQFWMTSPKAPVDDVYANGYAQHTTYSNGVISWNYTATGIDKMLNSEFYCFFKKFQLQVTLYDWQNLIPVPGIYVEYSINGVVKGNATSDAQGRADLLLLPDISYSVSYRYDIITLGSQTVSIGANGTTTQRLNAALIGSMRLFSSRILTYVNWDLDQATLKFIVVGAGMDGIYNVSIKPKQVLEDGRQLPEYSSFTQLAMANYGWYYDPAAQTIYIKTYGSEITIDWTTETVISTVQPAQVFPLLLLGYGLLMLLAWWHLRSQPKQKGPKKLGAAGTLLTGLLWLASLSPIILNSAAWLPALAFSLIPLFVLVSFIVKNKWIALALGIFYVGLAFTTIYLWTFSINNPSLAPLNVLYQPLEAGWWRITAGLILGAATAALLWTYSKRSE